MGENAPSRHHRLVDQKKVKSLFRYWLMRSRRFHVPLASAIALGCLTEIMFFFQL